MIVSEFDDCGQHFIGAPAYRDGAIDERCEADMHRLLAADEPVRIVAWDVGREDVTHDRAAHIDGILRFADTMVA